MIKSIKLATFGSYGPNPQDLSDLRRVNFVFGTNGTGKTTISRLVADETRSSTCTVEWTGPARLESLVYNRDFVEQNFNQSPQLPGVFTLGANQKELLEQIADCKERLSRLDEVMVALNATLRGTDGRGGREADLKAAEARLREACWQQKVKHDSRFIQAFQGCRGDKDKFKERVLEEASRNIEGPVSTLEDLERRIVAVFAKDPTTTPQIAAPDPSPLLDLEQDPILAKPIVGREDIDIAQMIRRLGNSDWVKAGREYFAASGGVCPFCQRETEQAFADQLTQYFDETFVADTRALDSVAAQYSNRSRELLDSVTTLLTTASAFLSAEDLGPLIEILRARIKHNLTIIESKQKEPSRKVELQSIRDVTDSIGRVVTSANARISDHNRIVANLAQERRDCVSQAWRWVVEELELELLAYGRDRAAAEKAIRALEEKLVEKREERRAEQETLISLERQITSVQPTVDSINRTLASFGFGGFKLAVGEDGRSYKLVRPGGEDAKDTLSEGERSFVTFLYFYQLLKGTNSDSAIMSDRVVVFDDPVSSLDSDVLFVVGTLIKQVIDEARSETGNIRQVFVLTHNAFFHKEVTFNPNRSAQLALKDESFWIVRRPGTHSLLERHPSNPISTSYDLLWSEVRRGSPFPLTIQNTLRRILENYFRIQGGVNSDRICGLFDGEDRLICKSLLSWVHDGSHYTHDDVYITPDERVIQRYLAVFRAIFEKSDHLAHYNMMMGGSLPV